MGRRIRNTFFTADWHIGHKNILKFDNRPFKDINHMREGLIRRYNSIVEIQDVVYFLGDMGFAGDDLRHTIDRLNGTKILVLGNHDKKNQAMLCSGFDAVVNSASMVIAGEMVTMTHCPLRGVKREDTTTMLGCDGTENWHREDKHVDFSIEDRGQFHLHGHTHAPNGGKSTVKQGRQWDIGVAGNKYIPVSISQIESWIVKVKKEEKFGRKT